MKVLVIGSSGYVGSYVKARLQEDHYDVTGIDNGMFGEPREFFFYSDYSSLEHWNICHFDVVVLLAGYPSPLSCKDNWSSVYKNNVANFNKLVGIMHSGQKLIYASSGSLANEPQNEYDTSKRLVETIATMAKCQTFGLRFGTVCGWNPYGVTRVDTLFNAIVYSGLFELKIDCANPTHKRAVLTLHDLYTSIKSIIQGKIVPGTYPLASLNLTVQEACEYARKILKVRVHHVDKVENNSPYNFTLCSDDFFSQIYDRPLSPASGEDIVMNLYSGFKNNLKSSNLVKRNTVVKYYD